MIALNGANDIKISSGIENVADLVLVSGIPGSGKSSFIRQTLANAQKSNASFGRYNLIVRLNFDKIERALAIKKENNVIFENSEDILNMNGPYQLLADNNNKCTIIKEVDIIRELKGTEKAPKSTGIPEEVGKPAYTYDQTLWKLARYIARVLCQNLITTIQNYQDGQVKALIILDDNFLLQSMRKPFYNMAATYSTGYCEAAFKVTLEKSLARNRARKEIIRVPDEIITSAFDKYQPTKYITNVVEVHNNEDNCWNQEQVVNALWENATEKLKLRVDKKDDELTAEEKDKLSKVNKESLLHQIDLGLRELIGLIMSGSRAKEENSTDTSFFKSIDREALKKIKNLGKILSTLKKIFLDICSYVYILIEKDKNFKLSLVEYLSESKTEYVKLVKTSGGMLSFEPEFEKYSEQLYKQIHRLFISLLEQEDFGNAQDRLINNLKEKVGNICTNSLLEILKTT
jgi:tRNA uridine 5-carbamoylmethylation protein Kti12